MNPSGWVPLDTDSSLAAILEEWIRQDRKHPALKALQGLLWRDGYETGELIGHLYADVPPVLNRLRTGGTVLGVYSSGSALAQRYLFRYSCAGDVSGLIAHFFDTSIGHKREAEAYRSISAALVLRPSRIAFLSDTEAELDAAAEAGMRAVQLVRGATQPSARHPNVSNFEDAVRHLGWEMTP
jgi:enolase-phosphatase E1